MAEWCAAANGNMVVLGTDEDFHNKKVLANHAMKYVANSPAGKTGLYIFLNVA
jgi:hypothetical protein